MNNSVQPLKILVFGAGAISTYIAGSLILTGNQVVFVARPSSAELLHTKGLRLDLTKAKRRNIKNAQIVEAHLFTVASSLNQALTYGRFDFCLLALKSYDTKSVLDEIRPFADKFPPILCLSNGVDNEAMIASVLGAEKVIYGTVTTAVARHGPGDIVLEKLRGIGISSAHPLSERLAKAMNSANLNCRLYSDAHSMKWSKMLTNLIANPASAILNMSASQIYANKNLYKMEIAMLKECLAVMRSQNLKVVDLPKTPVKALAVAVKLPLWLSKPLVSRAAGSGRGGKMPSFHIDLYSGRGKSEVQYLHGAVVREAKKENIAAPVNRLLTETLILLTHKQIPLNEFANQPEKFLTKLK